MGGDAANGEGLTGTDGRRHPSGREVVTSVVAATSLFVALAGARAVELVLKTTNPDRVDVTQGLAYLRPVLLTSLGLLLVAAVVTVLMIVRLGRAEGRAATRLPWVLLAVQAVVWFVNVVLMSQVAGIGEQG